MTVRINWFRAAVERPVNGGGNQIWIKPADPQPEWWGTNPSPELDRLISIFHEALFSTHPTTGAPTFRYLERTVTTDDDVYLSCTPDQMAFAVLDHADEITALIAAIREQATK